MINLDSTSTGAVKIIRTAVSIQRVSMATRLPSFHSVGPADSLPIALFG